MPAQYPRLSGQHAEYVEAQLKAFRSGERANDHNGRMRDLAGKRLRELTVHHKDHNHDNNPPDGSNWELLCIYCHDNEHQKHQLEGTKAPEADKNSLVTHQPFANLKDLLKDKK